MMNPKVSIRLMTYNQEKFIARAMDGIMMQKTDFPVEVVVGDDFSDDNTLSIIKQYHSTDKIKIKILDRKKGDDYWKKRQKKGRLYNFLNILENCDGEYVALLDGDDYWIDEYKLQKQVDFLEQNPEFNICFTRAYLEKDNHREPFPLPENNNNTNVFTYNDLLQNNNFIATASVMIRVNDNTFPKNNFPAWFYQIPYGDMGLYLLACKTQKIKCLPDFTTVYRIHSSGIWSGVNKINQIEASLQFHKLIFEYLTEEQQKTVRQTQKALINKKLSLVTGNKLKRNLVKYQMLRKYKLK